MNRAIHHHLSIRAAAGLLASAAVATVAAHAQTAAPVAPVAPTAAASASMNFQQVVQRVVAQGYADVREVERKGDKLYEVKARDAQNRRVELTVDARSGEILREEVKR